MQKGVVKDGYLLCSCCWKQLGEIEAGGSAKGVILWCKRCKAKVKF
jgi:predicted amidophosphoribosyltransferase